MTQGSVFNAQLDADHSCGTAAGTPGHIYDPYKPGKDNGVASPKFGTSVQRYSPEKGRNMGGPLVSKWVIRPKSNHQCICKAGDWVGMVSGTLVLMSLDVKPTSSGTASIREAAWCGP